MCTPSVRVFQWRERIGDMKWDLKPIKGVFLMPRTMDVTFRSHLSCVCVLYVKGFLAITWFQDIQKEIGAFDNGESEEGEEGKS